MPFIISSLSSPLLLPPPPLPSPDLESIEFLEFPNYEKFFGAIMHSSSTTTQMVLSGMSMLISMIL